VVYTDQRLRRLEAVKARLPDPRDGRYVRHDQLTLLSQRVHALCLGYENLAAITIQQVLVEQFIPSFSEPPEELTLDLDATDDRVHGLQEGRFFHGYYDAYGFLPLYVFCGEPLLVSHLRPGKIDGAKSWGHRRAVMAKLEVTVQERNPRFVVTHLNDKAQSLYDRVYCARGEMENRIKEQQLGLFADRTSAHHWWTNQFRLLLSSLAYVLMEAIRRLALHDTELAHAQVGTLRLNLLKIGAVILRNTRRIRFLLSSAFPHQDLFYRVVKRLVPG